MNECENSIRHELGEPGGGIEVVFLAVEVEAHFTLGQEVVVVATPYVGFAKVAGGAEDEFAFEFALQEFDSLGALGVLVAVPAEEEVDGEIVPFAVVEGFDSGVAGIGDVVDRGALAAEPIQSGASSGEKDRVDHIGAAVDGLDVLRYEKRVDVAVGDADFGELLSDFQEAFVAHEIAVTQKDHIGTKVGRGFNQLTIHTAGAKVAKLQGREECRYIAVAEVKDVVPVANKSVPQLVFRADAQGAPPAHLRVADHKYSHGLSLKIRLGRCSS